MGRGGMPRLGWVITYIRSTYLTMHLDGGIGIVGRIRVPGRQLD